MGWMPSYLGVERYKQIILVHLSYLLFFLSIFIYCLYIYVVVNPI